MSSRLKSLFFAPLVVSLLAGCASFEFPWVYKLNIDQGNIITQEMVNKLQPGMSRSQVQFVMGSPLIADPFHEDRWDYIYTLLDSKGKRTEQRLTVFFSDDKLSSLNGSVVPQSEEPAAESSPQAAVPAETQVN